MSVHNHSNAKANINLSKYRFEVRSDFNIWCRLKAEPTTQKDFICPNLSGAKLPLLDSLYDKIYVRFFHLVVQTSSKNLKAFQLSLKKSVVLFGST